jgi:tetratricopeptide (TPR) repeat protein
VERHFKKYSLHITIILKIFLVIFFLYSCARVDPLTRLQLDAYSLSNQGRYSEATEVAKEALQLAEQKFGSDHPKVWVYLNDLAKLYDSQGRYDEAEPFYKRALEVTAKALGPDRYIYTETARNDLYEEAELLYKRALEIREKALGPDHLYVAISLNNLARLYQIRGNYAEAEPLFKRSLEITEKTLGPEHPDVVTILENLTKCRREMGMLDEAENLD